MDWTRIRSHLWQLGSRVPEMVLRTVFPETCAGCGRTGSWVCVECEELLHRVEPPGCKRCGRRGVHRWQCWRCARLFPGGLKRVRAGFAYEGPMRRAIQRFKYNGEYQRGHDLGSRLADCVGDLFPRQRIDLVSPVPLHPRRLRSRGFNQSTILADCIAEDMQIPVVHPVRRVRNTVPQVRLSATERVDNLREAFEIDHSSTVALEDRSILIVDDVMTTGTTLAAMAGALQNNGCRSIYGLTLAREQ